VLIKVPDNYIKDYKVNGNEAKIMFNKQFQINIGSYNKKVITEFIKKDNTITIKTNPWASMYIAKENGQLRIVIANTPKTPTSVNISTAPPVSVEDQTYRNPESEKILNIIKSKLREKDFAAIPPLTDQLIQKNPFDKYAEEALFYSGVSYMELGKEPGKEADKALFNASAVFDDFIKKFPGSRLLPEAMLKSAEIKEKLGFKNEAVFVYQEILKTIKDDKYTDIAYTKLGQLYDELGQTDKALTYFTDYLKKNKPDNSPIYGYVGAICAKKGDFAGAEYYFSKFKPKKIDEVPPEILFWMAEINRRKENLDTALTYYTTLYNKFPNYEKTDLAMYYAGTILITKDKKNLGIPLLKDTKLKFSDKKGGVLSAVKVAELTLNSNDADFWSIYLSDAINNIFDQKAALEASKLLIKAYMNEKKYNKALNLITSLEQRYPASSDIKEIMPVKEDIYYNMILNYISSNNLKEAEDLTNKFLSEFSGSKKLNDILSIQEEIKYLQAKNLSDTKKYQEALKSIESYLSGHKQLYHKDKWQSLWETTLYNYTMTLKNDPAKFNVSAKNFITLFPSSSLTPQLKDLLNKNIISEFYGYINKRDYYNIVSFYQKNRNLIDSHPKKDSLTAQVAYALFMLGDTKNAAAIVRSVKLISNETELIKMMTGITPNRFNINNYNDKDFQKIIADLSKIDTLKAFQQAIMYKKNLPLAIKTAADLLEQMDGRTRAPQLTKFVTYLDNLPDNLKKSAYRVYFLDGENNFLAKRYAAAARSYEKYLSYAPQNDPIRADALYFLGKSYMNIKNTDLGAKYLNELIQKYPSSQYTNLAKSELEDIKWKSMKK
jgi:TolA-binding protein